MKIRIGDREFKGITALVLAIPLLLLAGIVLSFVLSVVGVLVTFIIGLAIFLVLGVLIFKVLPEGAKNKCREWGSKVFHTNNHTSTQKPSETKDGKPIIDVDFKHTDK